MSKRQWSLLFASLAVGALLAPAGFAQDPIKIGVIQPLSGPVAASGNYVRMGAEIARDWINAKGGVLGRKVELLIEDNKSDPKEAATAAEKLIVRDKVPVIMGAWGSSMTLAAMPKLEEYGVPMVVETSSAATITKRGNPWIFRISPPSEMEALGLEKYLKELGDQAGRLPRGQHRLGPRLGQRLRRPPQEVGRARSGAAEFMEQSATDMNAQITKVKAGRRRHAVPHHERGADHARAQAGAGAAAGHARSSPPAAARRRASSSSRRARPPRARYHILFFLPWFPEAMPDGKLAKAFVDEWAKRGHPFEGLTEGFRGHDGVLTAVEAHPARRQGGSEGGAGRALAGERDGPQRAHQVREGRPGRQGERAEQAQHLHRPGEGRQDRAARVRGQEVAREATASAWTSFSSTC